MRQILFLLVMLTSFVNINAQNSNAYFIQVATYADPQYKDFAKIHSIGYLFDIPLENGFHKIMMGTYNSYNSAKRDLAKIQAKGYKDAFISKVAIKDEDAAFIVQLATLDQTDKIYWGDWQRLTNKLCLQMSESKLRIAAGPFYKRIDAEKEMDAIKKLGGRQDIFIKRVSEKVLHPLSEIELQRSGMSGNKAAVRPTVKSLQAALNQAGYYSKEVDGQWGPNTKAALEQFTNADDDYEKYKLLSQQQMHSQAVEDYSLQYYLNLIDSDPFAAEQGLKRFKHPLAKVYLAYIYRNGDIKIENSQQTINSLMHDAIDMVFSNYRLKTRYDFSQKYSYEDIKQLIMHLRAVHEAVKDEPQVPCWLFRRHPQLAAEAFAPYFMNERDNFEVSSDCGSFLDLPQMQVLMTIAKDMGGSKENNLAKLNELYAFHKALPLEEMRSLEQWNEKIWKHLYDWSKASPLQASTYKVLKVSYYETLMVVENYFLKLGYSNRDARALGLKVLKQSVGCSLDEYCKGK
jgi:hypothetical protein